MPALNVYPNVIGPVRDDLFAASAANIDFNEAHTGSNSTRPL